ncbi:23796_t:CDS:1, partial [Racocetra persica]
ETKKDIILNLAQIQPYIDLLSFKRARSSLTHLKNLVTEIIEKARTHEPLGVFMYIERDVNNIVIFLSHDYDETNQAFKDAIEPYNVTIRYFEDPKRKRPPHGKRPPHRKRRDQKRS